MMYVAYTNDGPGSSDDHQFLLVVVLNDDILKNLKVIKQNGQGISMPYPLTFNFHFPVDSVRLIEAEDFDDLVKDCQHYEAWERGGDDPLEYYRYQVHNYEPKEDFWYASKPSSVELVYSSNNQFGFNAWYKGKIYYGYQFNWPIEL